MPEAQAYGATIGDGRTMIYAVTTLGHSAHITNAWTTTVKTKSLNAAQIDTLAQRLSATPVAASASAKKAGDNLAFLLAARIGDERAALAFTSILIAATAEQAEARLTLVLDYGNTEPAGEVAKVAVEEPKPPTATAIGKRQAILNQAQTGALPQAPDFSKATHVRFRASLPRLLPWPRQATSPPCRPSRSTRSVQPQGHGALP